MSFLSPLLLVLAVAAAVPLLLHLRARQSDIRVDFPAARYLARAERERNRELRLRNLLLMLLRVAAVVLIALAAAGPVARLGGRAGAAAGHAPMALAIVVDNTLSSSAVVGSRPALDVLKSAAGRIAGAAGSSDKVWLVTASGAITGGSPEAVADAIAAVQPYGGDGSLERAIETAAGVVASATIPEHRIVIVTDGQPASWARPIDVGGRVASATIVRPAFVLPANRAVLSADPRPGRWTPGGEIAARLQSGDTATYRLTLAGRTLARGTASATEEILMHAAPPERGWVAGTVEIEPDEMRGDDTRHFAVWIGQPPRVRVDSSAGRFVATAVDVLTRSGRLAAGSDIAVIAAQEAVTLPALLFAPPDPMFMGAANRGLERAKVPWRFARELTEQGWMRDLGPDHLVSVLRRYALTLDAAVPVDTLATVNGEPWIVAGDGYVLIASSMTPGATDFPIGAEFLPWLTDVLGQRLTARGERPMTAMPEERIDRPAGVDAMRAADGSRMSLTGPTFQAPRTPGVAMLMAGEVPVQPLVVNQDPRESELGQLDEAALAGRVAGPTVRVESDTARVVEAVFRGAARWPLALPLVVAALVALAAEAVVAARGNAPRTRGEREEGRGGPVG